MKYIIGIGANIGFTLENISKAIDKIDYHEAIQILAKASLYSSKAILKSDAPADWDIIYLNTAIKIESSLKPLDLLRTLKKIEKEIGRNLNAPVWSPRVIDLDILAAGDLILESEILTIPHKELLNRSFALQPLLELQKDWQHPKFPDISLINKLQTLDKLDKLNQTLGHTMLMGIVNLSQHSFSDGNLNDYQRKTNLYQLIDDGAEIIDIGAESTKPDAKPISIDEEFKLLDNFLECIKANLDNFKYRPLISIDTRKLEIMDRILTKHHDIIWMINDVESNDIHEKAKIIAKYNKKYVITHNLGITDRYRYLEKDNALNEVYNFINSKKNILIENGVLAENIYFDIGIGFGKKPEVIKYLLENINTLKNNLKLKALVGHSRKKSILNLDKNASIEELDIATKKLTTKLIQKNIDIIRIHKI